MTRETWSHPGTSKSAVAGFSGHAGVATHLNKMFGAQVTRQLVWTWYHRRASTMFPEKVATVLNGRSLMLFNLEDVTEWYRTHRLQGENFASLVSQDLDQ